jgi:phage-related protein
VGSSLEDLKAFPDAVQDHLGFALHQAQAGMKHHDAKPMKGLGSGVLEIVSRHDGDTYRAVYAVRFRDTLYVLHAFQKKARKGIATSRQDLDLIKRRLKAAQNHFDGADGKGEGHGHR